MDLDLEVLAGSWVGALARGMEGQVYISFKWVKR